MTIEPLDPALYSRILRYEDPVLGLNTEVTPPGYEADEQSVPLNVSDLELLKELVQSSPSYQSRTTLAPEGKTWFSRPWKTKTSFMDSFLKQHLSSASRWDYRFFKLRQFAEKVSFGEPVLLKLYECTWGIAWRVGVLRLLRSLVIP